MRSLCDCGRLSGGDGVAGQRDWLPDPPPGHPNVGGVGPICGRGLLEARGGVPRSQWKPRGSRTARSGEPRGPAGARPGRCGGARRTRCKGHWRTGGLSPPRVRVPRSSPAAVRSSIRAQVLPRGKGGGGSAYQTLHDAPR